MRYALAGIVAVTGLVLLGLAYHNTVGQAWNALRGAPASGASSTSGTPPTSSSGT